MDAHQQPRHPLDCLLRPQSVAVIGAGSHPDGVGRVIFDNLRTGGFGGPVVPVNPHRDAVAGVAAADRISDVTPPPELVVVAVPAVAVPDVVRECGEHGVKAAIVVSAGFREAGPEGARLEAAAVDAAREHGLRLLGPNCLGVVNPHASLHAIFGRSAVAPGRVALVSQSGAVCTAILDWAEARGVGFSAVVSLGAAADVGFGELLDYLALDPHTDSIVLYVEGIGPRRRFMSGLRVAARMKPVIVLKAGRAPAGARAAASHTGALVGDDAVFDSALRRAGAVRADSLEELFAASELLARGARTSGERLAVVTNAGGLGVMATDRAARRGITLAELSEATLQALDTALPTHWSHGNPVDVIGDATPERFEATLKAVMADSNVDGVLVLFTPQAMSAPVQVAETVARMSKRTRKPVLSCFMGGTQVAPARAVLDREGAISFDSPESAVDAFAHLSAFERNQRLLLQVPGPVSDPSPPDADGARLIVRAALAAGRDRLSLTESKALLRAFHIPVTPSLTAHSADEALVAAESVGLPVAMKIDSPQLSHKSDVGGVRLDIQSAAAVRTTYQELTSEAARQRPDAEISGVTVEPMHGLQAARELSVGVTRDAALGPAIAFGAGGTLIELIGDQAVALPPLNRLLARDMIDRTRVRALLDGHRNQPPVDRDALESVLLRVSEMVCEVPEIAELDINPLIASPGGVVAVDARVALTHHAPGRGRYSHVAIEPFPAHLARRVQLSGGENVVLRPIRPEDADIEQSFVKNLSSRSRYFRFMHGLAALTPYMLVRFTQIDYDREMAFIAVTRDEGREVQIGVARYVEDASGESCEFAVVVADAYQGKGLGSQLMGALIETARARGLRRMEGEVLSENAGMLTMVRHLGFGEHPHPEDPNLRLVRLDLHADDR
ncbi:MAG: bifunctional acetate--CoA ligase family protein/GNAT family N-acetyltransferase [Myxococcales bacterium]